MRFNITPVYPKFLRGKGFKGKGKLCSKSFPFPLIISKIKNYKINIFCRSSCRCKQTTQAK